MIPDVVPHDGLLVLADEDAVGRRAVKVAERREHFAHLVHEVGPQQVVLPLPVLVLGLGLEPAQLAGQMGSSPALILRQQFVVIGHCKAASMTKFELKSQKLSSLN